MSSTDGKVLLPMMHSGLAIVVEPPKNPQDGVRTVGGDARWYQGVDNIGFFPTAIIRIDDPRMIPLTEP